MRACPRRRPPGGREETAPVALADGIGAGTLWVIEALRIARRVVGGGRTPGPGERIRRWTMRVGFVGAGLMGAPMVRRLIEAGHEVTVSSRRPDRLTGEGWRVVSSPARAAEGAEVVCSIVPDSPEVTEVVESVLETAAAGTVVVEMSTISPAAARELAGRC